MESPFLETRDISFSYGERTVIDGVGISFQKGRIYGILGPNGSGKTTLLDIICGIIQPDTGYVLFRGRKLSSWARRHIARHMALVPQDFAVRFDFTVRQIVEMGRHPYLERFASLSEEDMQAVSNAMSELDVISMKDRLITRLSGGEKQRVITARALAQTPDVLMLDESTSNMDIHNTIAILKAVRKKSRNDGLTVIAVMHDINLAAMFCDELIFLSAGRIIHRGTVDEVMSQDIIKNTYGVESKIRYDEFAGCLQASFRL